MRKGLAMGIEMFIFGLRKLREQEIDELEFKEVEEIKASDYWTKLFPNAPHDAHYWLLEEWDLDNEYPSIKDAFTRIFTRDWGEMYVCWKEELAYHWHKDSCGRSHIEDILESADINLDDRYHVVPHVCVEGHLERRPSAGEDEEIVAFVYG